MPENVSLASAAAPGATLSTSTHLRVGIGHFGGQAREAVERRPNVIAAADLRFQERSSLIYQRRGLRPACVGLVDQRPCRPDQSRQFRPGAVERRERLTEQILEPGVVKAAHQVVGLTQQLGDVLRDRRALLRNGGTIAQQPLRGISGRNEIHVLFTDRRHALDGGGGVLRDFDIAVDPHARGDAVIGQLHGLDPSGLHAAKGDIGVLVQSAAGHEIRSDLIGTNAQPGGNTYV